MKQLGTRINQNLDNKLIEWCRQTKMTKAGAIEMAIKMFLSSPMASTILKASVDDDTNNPSNLHPASTEGRPNTPPSLIYNRKALVTQATRPEPIPGMTSVEYSELIEDWEAFKAGEIDY